MNEFVSRQRVAPKRDRDRASSEPSRVAAVRPDSEPEQVGVAGLSLSAPSLPAVPDVVGDGLITSRIRRRPRGPGRGRADGEPEPRIRRAHKEGMSPPVSVSAGRSPVVRRKWLDSGTPQHKWDALVRGIQWYRTKDADAFFFQVRSESAFLASHDKVMLSRLAAEQGKVKARGEWVTLLGGVEDAVPRGDAAIDVVPTAPVGGGVPGLDAILDPYLTGIPEVTKKDEFKQLLRPAVENLGTRGIDASAIVATLSRLGVKVATDDKMYCVENVLNGLSDLATNPGPFFDYVVQSLVAPTDRSVGIANAVAYGKAKGRLDATTFETVFKGVVFDIKRDFPRGFKDKPQFEEFSRDYRGLLGPYGDDIAVQGSAAIDVGGKVKDIDIAVLHDSAGFNRVLADKCTDKSKVLWKVLVAIERKTGNWVGTSISDADVTAGVAAIRDKDSRIGKITSAMSSIEYCHSRGVWKNSDFLTKTEKVRRDALDSKWMPELNLEATMDLSVVKRGGAFDKAPYLDLAR